MKNLRIAKKNPSKVLKIIEVPQTCRYVASQLHDQILTRQQKSLIKKEQSRHLNTLSYRQKSIENSPTHSNRFIEFQKHHQSKKTRNRSLGNSQEAIKTGQHRFVTISFRNSVQLRSKKDQNSYFKRHKPRQSEKLLNFNSFVLYNRLRKQQRYSKDTKVSPYGKRNHRLASSEQKVPVIPELKFNQESIKSAKRLLDQKEYRKSLLLMKSLLINLPHHNQALFLTGINWYYLQDYTKAIFYLEQVIANNPLYSSQCYKIISVSYYKSLELTKSLNYLKICHRHFPQEAESYELEGRILCKMQKFQEALKCYERGYQLSKTSQFLIDIGLCYEYLQQYNKALNCYINHYVENGFNLKICHNQMKLHHKLKECEQIIKLYELYQEYFNINTEISYEKQQIYELIAYSYYKLKLYRKCLIIVDQGIKICSNPWKFYRLQLMIKINERDIYEANHIINKIKDEPNLKVYCRFVEGVISLMRRNFNQGITTLLLLQNELGFNFEQNSYSKRNESQMTSELEYKDEFLYEIKRIYPMFLSYGYFNISQFFSCKKFLLLQADLGIPKQFQKGITYNLHMCQGIIYHCDRNFKEAQEQFTKAFLLNQTKLEPPFSLALNYIQLIVNSSSQEEKFMMIARIKEYFAICHQMVDGTTGNVAASVFYFSSLIYAYTQEWKEAINFIDQSIEKSQDHYWRYYFVRALYLSCIHSFKQAISDLILAINLSGQSRPQCFLLRSKCLQIQGQGNEAFKDLQEYLSLKPDDQEVHKYAGQLLFQNGAFQDALTAFSHQEISIKLDNYDIFLTKGKSYFLLGRFDQAYQSITICQKLKASKHLQFDLKIIRILHQMITKLQKPERLSMKIEQAYKQYEQMGSIFKRSDYFIFKAICSIGEQNYLEASALFFSSITQKSQELHDKEHEDNLTMVQNKKELQTFSNQMKYNIVLCHIKLGNITQAIAIYNEIKVELDQTYYGDFVSFRKFLLGQTEHYKKEEVFPNKNKFSNFIDKLKLSFKNKKIEGEVVIHLKLSIPFPKVQPPEIFPTFDENLLIKLSVLNVQRKPEAPWIIRQNNSIKFTDKMQIYSNFQLQDSESQSLSTYQMISIETSRLDKRSHCSKRIHTSFMEKEGSKMLWNGVE